jgi:cytochrome c553
MTSSIALVLIATGALTLPTILLAADPAAGQAGWTKEYPQTDGSAACSCATCHGRNLTQSGRHAKTGKVINPLAPSVNPQRLTDPAKIERLNLHSGQSGQQRSQECGQ